VDDLIFATLTAPGAAETNALLLLNSIRTFGGKLSDRAVLVGVPSGVGSLADSTLADLERLSARVVPISIDPDLRNFPFVAKVVAAAVIEETVHDSAERLCFLDPDTIVLREPSEFLIPETRVLGYRPVHHRLLGPAWNEPLDSFWSLVYRVCDVPEGKSFSIVTHAGEMIRPYFNAGVIVVRPQRGLFAEWCRQFLKWHADPDFERYYRQNRLYAIFMHQAILSGVILSQLNRSEMVEFSPKVNYPLHLHADVPIDRRPKAIDELVTVRHEAIFDGDTWRELPFSERLTSWLDAQLRIRGAGS
jgi:hypothetical protein